jgi:N-acetylglucosaminyldiphosphoundecaprenol N-acetyl-beta-D-mannosaminyltransferase
MERIDTVTVLGVPVAQVTYGQAVERILAWAESRGSRARSVIAANTHVLTEAVLRAEYGRAVVNSDMIVPDGMPLVWGSRLLGGAVRRRCYGPELMRRTLAKAEERDIRHYLYGSTESTVSRLAAQIRDRWPGTQIAGMASPPFGEMVEETETAHVEKINASGAGIVWVGMGCPKQELWMDTFRDRLTAGVVLGVGAAFDFLSGTKPGAPQWVQDAGLEWCFRLRTEPRRLWRRYLFRNPLFVALFVGQLLGVRKLKEPARRTG